MLILEYKARANQAQTAATLEAIRTVQFIRNNCLRRWMDGRGVDPHSLIGLEELTGIRERVKRKQGKKASQKQRRANRHISKWAFAEVSGLLPSKAALTGSVGSRVAADYTSQLCPRCGQTSRANRPEQGVRFVCQHCQFTLHADLVGARTSCLRTRCIRQDWIHTGQLSSAPDVTDDEAKAARRSREAEVRWSSATSLPL